MATAPQVLAPISTVFSACKPKDDVLQGTRGVASIFRLDTSYGGGKTHGLIALVHAVRSGRTIPNIGDFVAPALCPLLNRPQTFKSRSFNPRVGKVLEKKRVGSAY